jgi:hypothetical protein
MFLLYDTGSNAEVLRVTGASTGVSIPVVRFAKAHGTSIAFGQLLATPAYSAIESVPNNPGWGF